MGVSCGDAHARAYADCFRSLTKVSDEITGAKKLLMRSMAAFSCSGFWVGHGFGDAVAQFAELMEENRPSKGMAAFALVEDGV
jgi:hypothetical protein